MRFLLDTHAFLWFVLGDSQLSATAKAVISDPQNQKWLSPASYWEIAIKISIGKYQLNEPIEDFVTRAVHQNGFCILPIEVQHAAVVVNLPFHHRDPFDRMLVAQAQVEQMPLISNDPALDAYNIQRLW